MSKKRKMLAEMLEKGNAKDLRTAASKLDDHGRGGDTLIAHINPREAALLKALGGSGTINPKTGLLEFEDGSASDGGAGGGGGDGGGGYGGGGDSSDTSGAGFGGGYDGGYGGPDGTIGVGGEGLGGAPSGGYADAGSWSSYGGMGGSYGNDMGSWDGPLAGVTGPQAMQSYGQSASLGQRAADFAGAKIGDAMSRPAETMINTVAGFALGPVGLANTVSGWLGGPTLGSMATGIARGFGGESQTASAKGDGGPLSGDTTGGGNSLASGSGSSPLGANSAQSPLAAALLGSPPDPSGRKTYGARVSSFSPFGREYTTPWAYRG